MTGSIFSSIDKVEQAESLAGMGGPNSRMAYSNRVAWQMACYSELAYLKFDEPKIDERVLAKLEELFKGRIKHKKLQKVLPALELLSHDPVEQQERLLSDLRVLNISLVKTFSTGNTQAILLVSEKYAVLAFRGTEATCIGDIKSDVSASTIDCITEGKVHSGFSEAFNLVESEVVSALKDPGLRNKPLYFTGHSLGGALATIAAKRITHKGGNAACYTFGAPRVGDDTWISEIKTPIYRLVNAADGVTMMPPGHAFIQTLSWVLRLIPAVGISASSWILSRFSGYIHGGNMRYLTNCRKGNYKKVKLLYTVNIFYRAKGMIVNKMPWMNVLADHSISTYREKLATIAVMRNRH
ncbi:lipase (class 3) [Marinimicrobium koreense]|uniref:Lipase (Class 3) n=1 Tax=Marinimicrobium koreense TaxID=306545 RepID=A0A3N1NWE7_9GAMM|nr:lipase family protein [Marinimicrobium koreense]ROQ20159.1 lipase (class 3) [Marinimicrobium koreense]